MLHKLDMQTKHIIEISQSEAKAVNTKLIEPEHLLIAILKEDCSASMVLRKYKVNISNIKRVIRKMKISKTISGKAHLSENCKKILDHALELIVKHDHENISPEHLLYSLVATQNRARTIINKLTNYKVVKEQIQKVIFDREQGPEEGIHLPHHEEGGYEHVHSQPRTNKRTKRSALEAFGKNLTEMAKQNKLDPVIGRTEEMGRLINILTRRKKNNPVLVGYAGVGKTSIVEGIAHAIAKGNVPEKLRNKKIYSIDLGLMVAGTKYRGQFEERIKALLKEVTQDKDIIIFLDEIHTIVGAGSAEGSLDAANIMKPALAKGEIKCIGATTIKEYRKSIEKDAALERRFHPVTVQETSIEETFTILKELQQKYEEHHGVTIGNESIYLCCKLSKKYINDRYLPDKAIDVLDEAAAYVSLGKTQNVSTLKDKIKRTENKRDSLLKEGKFRELNKVHNELKSLNQKLFSNAMSESGFTAITPETVKLIVSEISKIPITDIKEDEKANLANMEKDLQEVVINQNEAIDIISKVVKKSRVGMSDPKRPIGSFMFVGATGVGKTHIAKQLAKIMFGSEEALVQVNMSEYMEKHSVSKMIGSPPGYVGYEDAGQLTEMIRRRPYSVILLDEIEKAHPELLNVLLQVFEEGELTDNMGRKTSFKNSIIIMTSNVGVKEMNQKSVGFGKHNNATDAKHKVQAAIKDAFRPEFINRLDNIVFFNKLSKDDISKIVELEVKPLIEKLNEINIKAIVHDNAIEFIANTVNPDEFGARPVKRAIATLLEDKITDLILEEKIPASSTINIKVVKGELSVVPKRKYTRRKKEGN